GASHIGGRLFKSAATSALAFSAVVGGVVLSGGEAQALTLCNFPTCDGSTATVGDKYIKVVSGPAPGTGNVEFYQIGNQYQVDVDFDPDFNFVPPNTEPGVSIFEYVIKVTDPHYFFHRVSLDATFGLSPNNASVKKEIFTNNNHAPGTLKAVLECVAGQVCPVEVDISDHWLTELYIRDTATTGGQLIDAYQNSYVQSEKRVPAPLPILGAAAAFGSIRKARKFSSHLKTFSMG
ncbi:MAG: hypothetical protein VKN56_09385, partial [Cyanobacteriota bacterium]|nr:hypothetical protein [Cyanobacteriota bacterium]